MKLALIIIIAFSVVILAVGLYFLFKYLKNKENQSDVLSLPSYVNLSIFETYCLKNFRTKNETVSLPIASINVPITLIPKFTTNYYKSIYYDVTDIKENALAAIYLIQIGNINLASKILHSIIYLMVKVGWNPLASNGARITTFTGLPRYYNINIVSNSGSVALHQTYSDISSIYASIAFQKFILTFDSYLQQNNGDIYQKIINLYNAAAYDLIAYIANTQTSTTNPNVFMAYKLDSTNNTGPLFTSSFHIMLIAACNFIDVTSSKYTYFLYANLNTNQIRTICNSFINTSSNQPNSLIIYSYGNDTLQPNTNPVWDNTNTEDYLSLMLLNIYPNGNSNESLLETVLSTFYFPDTDYTTVGCGPNIYNPECSDQTNPTPSCYIIDCTSKYVPPGNIYYGIKWSTNGSGITFAMSSLTLFAAALNINNVNNSSYIQELNNIKNSLLKIYTEYGDNGILGGFQEELAFTNDPLNTGIRESMFRYGSLIATIYTAFSFSYLKYRNSAINYFDPNNNVIIGTTEDILGFDISKLYSY
jgi:hypothetical protein